MHWRRKHYILWDRNCKSLWEVSYMRTVCLRLRRGDDLLLSLEELARREDLRAAVILSGVGCVTQARVRDASGATVRHIAEPCEIVSLNGTVSAARCHVHIALSREDMTTLGGHLMAGTYINTTCELVLLEQDGVVYGVEQDAATGYDEIVFQEAER